MSPKQTRYSQFVQYVAHRLSISLTNADLLACSYLDSQERPKVYGDNPEFVNIERWLHRILRRPPNHHVFFQRLDAELAVLRSDAGL